MGHRRDTEDGVGTEREASGRYASFVSSWGRVVGTRDLPCYSE